MVKSSGGRTLDSFIYDSAKIYKKYSYVKAFITPDILVSNLKIFIDFYKIRYSNFHIYKLTNRILVGVPF